MADTQTFTFTSLPKNVAELTALPEYALATPFQACALTILALCRYAEDANDGIAMLNSLKGPQPLSNMELAFIKERFQGKDYLCRSYLGGTSPQNNYAPSQPYTITIFDNPYSYAEDGYAKLLVRSSGADTERGIKARQKGAQWFLWEQYLLPSIRPPAADDPWA